MYTRDRYNLIGPVRSVISTFCDLEVVDGKIVEIRPQEAGYLLFDSEGRLLEEVSPDRILMDDIFRDVYVYNSDGKLIEREEYGPQEKLIGKAMFEIDDEGNLVENHFYLSVDGELVLESRLIHRQGKVKRIQFNLDGTVEPPYSSKLPVTTVEISEIQTDSGRVTEERRYNDKKELALRIVTRYDRRGK